MKVVITANGEGSRMKCLSPLPKHELYYGDKKIIDLLLEKFPGAEVLTGFPSKSRRETLERIRDYEDCLIVDCDIVIDESSMIVKDGRFDGDVVYCFISDKQKYSSVKFNNDGIYETSENNSISDCKSAGVYYVKSVSRLLDSMTNDNSIVSGMIGAKAILTKSIIPVGDPSDYYEALGIKGGSFTGNRIEMNKNTVIKYCKTGRQEAKWYNSAKGFNRPDVYYHDEEMIITERIYPTERPTANDFIRLIEALKSIPAYDDAPSFDSYLNNLPNHLIKVVLPEHEPTFFHGDLSTTNVLKNSKLWLIDPNYKDIFGSWMTDAGKAVFSFIAYEQDYPSAKKIVDHFGLDIWLFAVAEGLRVCKYRPEYSSIVNNIAELCQRK